MNTIKRKRAERIAKIAKREVIDATIEVETPVEVEVAPLTPAQIKKQKAIEKATKAAEKAAAEEAAKNAAAEDAAAVSFTSE